jgi:hypothetical protein
MPGRLSLSLLLLLFSFSLPFLTSSQNSVVACNKTLYPLQSPDFAFSHPAQEAGAGAALSAAFFDA